MDLNLYKSRLANSLRRVSDGMSVKVFDFFRQARNSFIEFSEFKNYSDGDIVSIDGDINVYKDGAFHSKKPIGFYVLFSAIFTIYADGSQGVLSGKSYPFIYLSYSNSTSSLRLTTVAEDVVMFSMTDLPLPSYEVDVVNGYTFIRLIDYDTDIHTNKFMFIATSNKYKGTINDD